MLGHLGSQSIDLGGRQHDTTFGEEGAEVAGLPESVGRHDLAQLPRVGGHRFHRSPFLSPASPTLRSSEARSIRVRKSEDTEV